MAAATTPETSDRGAPSIEEAVDLVSPREKRQERPGTQIINGWITLDGRVLTGGHLNPTWWRGTLRPQDAAAFGPSITRFAPGRYGAGLTDELADIAATMFAQNQVAYDHHYGLWYDRRRDDHLMVRRATGSVAPPFFEQPFARTGRGIAWDGLSRYDLTKFNPWYWQRLAKFSELCDQQGLVLFHQHYFQHNVLEAGAHWADCPWRPANNINNTGLPEPPPYVGDKRIFIAHRFYDTSNDSLRKLHEGYILHCLDSFAGRSNVIHSIGAEYTGPFEFTQFWIDRIARWQRETGDDPLVALACTKDVQDAILTNSDRAELVDVVDIRYWCYDKNGELYAPRGGVHLAPRQHMRQLKPDMGDFASVARAVREYRIRYPAKAVTYFADMYCRSPRDGWAVLMGGGSLANLPPLPEGLTKAIPRMAPVETNHGRILQLAAPEDTYLLYALDQNEPFIAELPGRGTRYQLVWINPVTGGATEGVIADAGSMTLKPRERVLWIRRIAD